MKKTWGILVIAVWLTSCGQIEFPDGALSPVKQEKDVTKYGLGFEEVMEFHEGKYAEYAILANVPEGGTPQVTVENLPPTATFSPEQLRIKWRVPQGFVKESTTGNHFSVPIRIALRAVGEPEDTIVRKAVLLVFED